MNYSASHFEQTRVTVLYRRRTYATFNASRRPISTARLFFYGADVFEMKE